MLQTDFLKAYFFKTFLDIFTHLR